MLRSLSGQLRVIGPTLGSLLAVLFWLESLHSIHPLASSYYGLVTTLPAAWWAALGITVAAVLGALSSDRPSRVAIGSALTALILVLHGTLYAIQPVARFASAYATAGFSQYIGRTGATLPHLDARMSWPGAFAALGMLGKAAGVNTYWFLSWSPLVLNFVYLVPLKALANVFLRTERARWASLALFTTANWIGQDYLSPQGINVLLYLAILAILARVFIPESSPATRLERLLNFRRVPAWLRARRRANAPGDGAAPDPSAPDPSKSGPGTSDSALGRAGEALAETCSTRQAMGYYAVLLFLCAASVISHQFTPAALASTLFFLTVLGLVRLRYTWIIVSVFVLAWLSWVAEPYWSGHIREIFGGVSQIGHSVGSNVTGRVSSTGPRPTGRTVVQYSRVLSALVIWGSAVLVSLWGRYLGVKRQVLLVLLLSPLALLIGITYGGEAALRALLLGLAPAAILVASALDGPPDQQSRRPRPYGHPTGIRARGRALVACLAVLAFLVLAATFPFTRYGNEKFEAFSSGELRAARYVQDNIPQDGLLLMDNLNAPVGGDRVNRYRFRTDELLLSLPPKFIKRNVDPAARHQAIWFYFSDSIASYGTIFSGKDEGWMQRSRARLVATGSVETVYKNRTATVFRWVPGNGRHHG